MHHLDHDTSETLVPLFGKNPGGVEKNSAFNKLTMPSRNYAIIAQSERGDDGIGNSNGSVGAIGSLNNGNEDGQLPNGGQANGNKASTHAPTTKKRAGGLDVTFRVEINQHDAQGATDGYGFSIPPLEM